MKVLSIGSDKNLFIEDSDVRRRIIEYGELVDELHIVILNQKSNPPAGRAGLKSQNFGNVFLYPANSRSRWFYIFDAYKIAKKILAVGGHWLITSQDPFESGLVGWFIKRKFCVSLQLQIHTDFLSPYFWRESVLNKIRVIIAKFLIPRAGCLRVVSERIRSSILGRLNLPTEAQPPIVILPIFVDAEKIKNSHIKTNLHDKYPQFGFVILMASRLTKEKNISMPIDALVEIVKKHPKTGLIIVGSGPEENKLKLKIIKLKLENNIILEPWSNDLVSYYKTADLFLLTSNYEGYGMAVVEAMIAGCPIVMTDVGLAGELLTNDVNGIVIPVGDKLKLQEVVSRIIENPDLKIILKENGQKIGSSLYSKEEYLKNYKNSWLVCFQD